MNYIIVTGIFQAIVALLFLAGDKLRRSAADNLLMLLLACIGTHLLIKLAIFNFVQDVPVRERMNTFIGFCYGPVLLLYARKVRAESFVPLQNIYLFIPFLLALVGYLTVVSTLSISREIGHLVLSVYNGVTGYSLCGFNLIFSVLAFRVSRSPDMKGKREATLIRRIALCLALVSVIGLGAGPFAESLGLQGNLLIRSICYLFLSMIGILILRYQYFAPALLSFEEPIPDISEVSQLPILQEEPIVVSENEASRKIVLDLAEHQSIFNELEAYLLRTSAYSDADLSLEKLARAIGVSRHNLSETLNHFVGKSFYQYINEWRIRHIKEQINDLASKEIPINFLILAYESGFKAKSSFNTYFKKITGCTPTAYLKGLNEPALA